jgi:ABC-type transport system involved in cytochrome bd biosynthesis fused ATPase/permease subunit
MCYTEALCRKLEADAKLNAEARACTGSLAVHPRSRDVKIDNLSISFHGHELLQDTTLELNCGRRYGLLGLNGSGEHLFQSRGFCRSSTLISRAVRYSKSQISHLENMCTASSPL